MLIYLSSRMGRAVVSGVAAYSASKVALEARADNYQYELAPFGIDSVIVEPGIHRTPILEKFLPPTDQSRVGEYDSTAEAIERIRGVFETASSSETPGLRAFVQLIETNVGEQPFQTVPTRAIKPRLEPYNTGVQGSRIENRKEEQIANAGLTEKGGKRCANP